MEHIGLFEILTALMIVATILLLIFDFPWTK